MNTREKISFFTFFLLPVTLNYFSPVLLVQAGLEQTFSIMHIIFGLMAVSAIIFGSAWCGYVCPFGALQNIFPDNGKKPKILNSKFPNLKYITGILFLLMVLSPIIYYGFKKIIIFYHMEDTKVTMDSLHGLILYYIITGSIILLTLILGKRMWCRYLCPMYIFCYIGMFIGKIFRIPRLSVSGDSKKCVQCLKCNDCCTMGLDIAQMVKTKTWNYKECIQCGKCIDSCNSHALKRCWKRL